MNRLGIGIASPSRYIESLKWLLLLLLLLPEQNASFRTKRLFSAFAKPNRWYHVSSALVCLVTALSWSGSLGRNLAFVLSSAS